MTILYMLIAVNCIAIVFLFYLLLEVNRMKSSREYIQNNRYYFKKIRNKEIKLIMEIVENSKGFKVLKISRKEMIDKLSKAGSLGICDKCGKSSEQGYYVAVLNFWLCPQCYKSWYKDAIRYKEDEAFEQSKYNLYCNIFESQ